MKNCFIKRLALILIFTMIPFAASAENQSISFGGKIGFMYENMSVTLQPKLKNVAAEDLVWKSSDDSVAKVKNGKITSIESGKTIISASFGNTAARCGVVILPEEVEIIAGESFDLPNAGVEKYAVQHKSIATVSAKGKITAHQAGETYIRVKYGKQTLYVKVIVSGGETMHQSAAAGLDCAGSANQIILVEHEGGSNAKLSIHEKKNGAWTQLYECTAYIGKNGIGKTREGDHKTPVGTFNLCQPFGIYSDPGANMEYTKVTKYHYWCGTSGSEYYNQMVDERVSGRACTSSDEHLIDYRGEYNYCMFIDYNAEGEAGKGSCIFLHCTGNKNSTAGCIAVPEKVMKKIVQWAQPGIKIVIR